MLPTRRFGPANEAFYEALLTVLVSEANLATTSISAAPRTPTAKARRGGGARVAETRCFARVHYDGDDGVVGES